MAALEGLGEETGDGTPAEGLPSPTPPFPIGADDALQTIGGLGGSLTLGRPSALEIRYQETERVVALPIDPARVTNKGELPYNAAVMASDNPVLAELKAFEKTHNVAKKKWQWPNSKRKHSSSLSLLRFLSWHP
jgi:hypothetical protein